MRYFICVALGYLIGSLSPAALIAKIKNKNLNDKGDGSLGATSVAVKVGRVFGVLVMIIDVLKGFFASKIASWLVPAAVWLSVLTGFFAVLGHCFPFYLGFKGGKGLATFGGVVLACDPLFFLFALVTGIVIVLVSGSGTSITYYAALLWPIYAIFAQKSPLTVAFVCALSLYMMIMFIPDLKKAIKGQERKSRDFLKKKMTDSEQTADNK